LEHPAMVKPGAGGIGRVGGRVLGAERVMRDNGKRMSRFNAADSV
jgi:hypothetical protein